MAVTDKLKGMVEELRQDLWEVKEQVKQLLPRGKASSNIVPIQRQGQQQGASEHPIVALQRETNRLFDDFLRGASPFSTALAPFGDLIHDTWPRIDIVESDDELRLRADLAGMDRDDIDLSLADGVLTIRGEKRYEDENQGRHHYRRECFYGSFSRSVAIPGEVDLQKGEAKMKNGVLQITMPKLPGSGRHGRHISIGNGK